MSHGGDYMCVVTISILKLNLSLTGTAKTTIIVQSKLLRCIPLLLIINNIIVNPYKHFCIVVFPSTLGITVFLSVLFTYPAIYCYSVVPAPSVVIERVGDPFNGSVFTLSCIVTVSQSVDTNISISTQWGLPVADKQPETISNASKRVAELVGHHNLTFNPLRSQDSGQYECNATISPGHGDTVAQNTAVKHYHLTVQSEEITMY